MVGSMIGVLGGRLIAISALLILFSILLKEAGTLFYTFVALSYIITIPYSLWMRNKERMRQLAPLQFLVDIVFTPGWSIS